jgi:CubicO group peptidase (beta-lactamase class C family)
VINGAVAMDDNIRVFIPEMPRVDPPVTVGNLMYHTSGIADYVEMLNRKGIAAVADDLDIVEMLAKEDMLFAAGAKYSPSRSDYFLLAFVVQRITSLTVAEWAEKLIFNPLAMSNTIFSDHPQKKPTNVATGYEASDSQGHHFKKSVRNLASIAGDAGLYTNVDDLLLWEKALYTADFGGDEFGKLINSVGKTSDGTDIDYVSGMDIRKLEGAQMLSCVGRTDGFSGAMLRVPQWKLTVICVANRTDIDIAALADGVIRLCVAKQ